MITLVTNDRNRLLLLLRGTYDDNLFQYIWNCIAAMATAIAAASVACTVVPRLAHRIIGSTVQDTDVN